MMCGVDDVTDFLLTTSVTVRVLDLEILQGPRSLFTFGFIYDENLDTGVREKDECTIAPGRRDPPKRSYD